MTENKLEIEIEKWKEKLNNKLSKTKKTDKQGEWILENAKAYQKDSQHFHKNNNLIEGFESLIWAWAFLEIGEKLDHITKQKD